jgi:curved DNA-binding protein CbpA
MADETYYSLLEVSEVATATEIKAAYLRLIREVHPDRLAGAPAYWQRQAEEKAKEVNEAYAVLSNREKRHQYDVQLASYRGLRDASGRQPSAKPTSSGSATQQAPPASGPRSGAHGQSAQNTGPARQQRGPSSSPPPAPPNRSAKYSPPSVMSRGQRLSVALIGGVFAFGGARAFWGSTSTGEALFTFVVASMFLFGIACLYQLKLAQLYNGIGLSSPRRHLWVTFGVVAFFLLAGKIVSLSIEARPSSAVSPPLQHPLAAGGQIAAVAPEGAATQPPTGAPTRPLLSIDEFAAAIKRKYPAYKAIDNRRLALAFVAKYPVYKSRVNCGAQPTRSPEIDMMPSLPKISGGGPVDSNDQRTIGLGSPRSPDDGDPQGAPASKSSGDGNAAQPKSDGPSSGVPRSAEKDVTPTMSSSDRASIESACSGARLGEGAAAYHSCLDDQLRKLAEIPNAPDLSRLNASDRASIGSACSGARLGEGAAAYHRCLDDQLHKLAEIPNAPDLSRLNASDRASIESACSGARLGEGAAAYHRCLRVQLSELGSR